MKEKTDDFNYLWESDIKDRLEYYIISELCEYCYKKGKDAIKKKS